MRGRLVVVVLGSVMAWTGRAAEAGADLKVESTVVAPAMQPQEYVVSPRGVHLAAFSTQGSRAVVLIDGVPGPLLDELVPFMPTIDRNMTVNQARAIFSADGNHYAYIARSGENLVVYRDGKELIREPATIAAQLALQFFGAAGEHLYFTDNRGRDLYELWVDGKQQAAPFSQFSSPKVTPDGAHFAFVATPPQDRKNTVLVVDGKAAGYTGENPQFTGDGKHLVSIGRGPNEVNVQLDGKPVARASGVEKVYVAASGDRFAAVLSKPSPKGAQYYVFADGAEVPGTISQTPPLVVFSPDGKHMAARVAATSTSGGWVVVDGRKQTEYRGIDDKSIIFSPDSAHLAYVAGSNSKNFVVFDGKESAEGFDASPSFWFSADGKHFAYAGYQTGNGQQPRRVLVVDGKEAFRGDFNSNTESFAFVGGGSRWVLREPGNATQGQPLVDGKPLEGFRGNSMFVSADGNVILHRGQRVADNVQGLFADGKLLTRGAAQRYFLSRDGKHVYWDVIEQPKAGGRPVHAVYADGVLAAKYDNVAQGMFGNEGWGLDDDGTLVFLAPVDGNVKRFRVTPSADTSVATAAAALQTAEAQAKADADKSAADAKAAKDKAAADALAAREKAKADADQARADALAARQKARDDAAAARAKAKADADAARAAKRKN